MGCENCENVRKTVKICFSQLNPKEILCKTLQKSCEKLRLSQYFAIFLSIRTTRRRGKWTLTTGSAKTVENPLNAMLFASFSPYFREDVLLRNLRYFANIFCNFLNFRNYSQLLFL